MEGQVESVGLAATAGAAAVAMEGLGARRPGDGTCANCGATVHGRFCGMCGQALHFQRTIRGVVEELVHGILHFDGKLWRTLPALAVHPGRLTREYVEGRRARYVNPVALFLMTVLLTFVVFSFAGGGPVDGVAVGVSVTEEDGQVTAPERVDSAAEAQRVVDRLSGSLAEAEGDPAREGEVRALRAARDAFVVARDQLAAREAGEPLPGGGEAPWAAAIRGAAERGDLTVDLGHPGIDQRIMRSLYNPELVLYKMKQKGYKLSFLLVPLSLPWMLLAFPRRRDAKVYDHVVFLLYSLSFISMLGLVAVLLASAGVSHRAVYFVLLFAVPAAHLYRQLKGAYALSRGGALWRTAFLGVGAVLTLSFYSVVILLLGILD